MTTSIELREKIEKDFIDSIRNVVANAILTRNGGEPVFSGDKIIGQIEMTVKHYVDTLLSSDRKALREKIGKLKIRKGLEQNESIGLQVLARNDAIDDVLSLLNE